MPGGGRGCGCGQGGLLEAALLLLIAERKAYGYELTQRLLEFGVIQARGNGWMGPVYRVLTRLEEMGLVSAEWDTSFSPPRKMLSITADGWAYLDELTEWARQKRDTYDMFISRREQLKPETGKDGSTE